MSDLTERLGASLREAAARRQAALADQAAADHLELADSQDLSELEVVGTDHDTGYPLYHAEALDEESDRQVDEMFKADEKSKFALTAFMGLAADAGTYARQLMLTAALAARSLPIHEGIVLSDTGQPMTTHTHMITDLRLVCSCCLNDVRESLDPKAQQVIVKLSEFGPVDRATILELASDDLLDRLLARVAEHTAPRPPDQADLGSLPGKLADLLKERL